MKKNANSLSNTTLSITSNQLHVSAIYIHHQAEYKTISTAFYDSFSYLWFCIQSDDSYMQPKHVADCWL